MKSLSKDDLKDQSAPLIVAGVDSHLPLYREANTYPELADSIVPGNPEEVPADELRRLAWKHLAPVFEAGRTRTAQAIEDGLNQERASTDVKTAVAAACQGRAASTFVPLDTEWWGTWDANTARVRSAANAQPPARDLLDLAAVQTLLHGGDVYPVNREADMPGGGQIAVLLRF